MPHPYLLPQGLPSQSFWHRIKYHNHISNSSDNDTQNKPEEFEKLYHEDTYEAFLTEYMRSSDYSELGYEHLLVYFVYRYLMNAIYDYDILSYAKMIVMATLVVRDMDAARFYRNGGKFTMSDRIDVARIFSKEVEHS